MSQSNESENKPELDVTNVRFHSPDEFTQFLRTFCPRGAEVSVDEIFSEFSPEIVTAPILFPARAIASQTSNTPSSFLRIGAAWACGLLMGATITALLFAQFQNPAATQNDGLANSGTRTGIEESRESSSHSSEGTAVANSTRTLLVRDRQELRYSIRWPDDDFFENRQLSVSHRWLKSKTQSDSGRSLNVSGSESKSSDPTIENTFEIKFEPNKPKSLRHNLMKELLEESI